MTTAIEPLRSAIERLASIDRSSCSKGEREAAEWIATALRDLGAQATVEIERVHGTYWWPLGITSGLGIVAAGLTRRGRRAFATALGALASVAVIDDLSLGPRLLRRLLPKQTTANVAAIAGDREGSQTLVVVAHHDAAHTSIFFDPRIAAALGSRFRANADDPPRYPPLMAPIPLAPALVAVGALTEVKSLVTVGKLMCWGIIGSFIEIALRPTVPGANDNLTGVATVLALARALNDRPVAGLRVVLVTTGAEESLMEGMRAFADRHFATLRPDSVHVLCVDTVGSPQLVLAEAEGMLQMRAYDGDFNEDISACATREGVPLRTGFRMRFGTDGLVALRRGLRAAMLTSVNEYGVASNYHWPTDTPDRVDYDTVGDAVRLCEAVVRLLAKHAADSGDGLSSAGPAPQPARRPTAAAP